MLHLMLIHIFTGIIQDGSIKPVSEAPSVIAERLEESEIQVCFLYPAYVATVL